MNHLIFAVPACGMLIFANAAAAQDITTSFGIDFVTVGDAGNRDTIPSELIYTEPELFVPQGGVAYEYQIAQTEVTAGQWLEFTRAYEPFLIPGEGESDSSARSGLAGRDVVYSSFSGEFTINGAPDRAARVEWIFATRFANWIHNGRVNEAWAFETGAYDTSAFGVEDENGNPTFPLGALPGARVRLPTADEWIKAAHYDPNRYGEGEGGYWRFQDGGDDLLIAGPPGVGETDLAELREVPVGSYPDVLSPWGALDMGGTSQEWGNGPRITQDGQINSRIRRTAGPALPGEFFQAIDFVNGIQPAEGSAGATIRLVTTVPAPSVASLLMMAGLIQLRRRR